MDPEIPVLSVLDLGIVRSIRSDHGELVVDVAPTYSGCPAMEVIEHTIARELERHGYERVNVRRVLSPPWTTDWISDEGRRKLRHYGIAPPDGAVGKRSLTGNALPPSCPRCDSTDTRRLSEFGSTACKAAWRCNSCLEPFEYFKCI
jgi:ring-1,2-phenylacetyl-CoA epoxidase subunit PaaD